MTFWDRAATLQIGPKLYNLSNLYFTFDVPFVDSEELNTAKITAHNLSKATRSEIKRGMVVIVNAGYAGDLGCIFVGKVSRCVSKQQGTEWLTTITAATALDEWLTSEVNKTYAAGSKASAILKDLLNIFGVEIGTFELVVDKEYPRGKVCKGKVKDIVREIATLDCKSRFLIRNGTIIINDPTKGQNMGYLLSAATGLLKATDEMEDTEPVTNQTTIDDGGEAEEQTYTRRCLLNYHLAAANVVTIQERILNGAFLIKAGRHIGNPTGDWVTEIEVKPV